MNGQQKEIFRETVLRAFKAAGANGLSLVTLDVTLRVCGFKHFEKEEMETEVLYFMDKGFVTEVPKSHSLGNHLWRLTGAGRMIWRNAGCEGEVGMMTNAKSRLLRRQRGDTYVEQLSEEERTQLIAWLFQTGLSLEATRQRALAWKEGRFKGKKPSVNSLSRLACKLRVERGLAEAEALAAVERAAWGHSLGAMPAGPDHEDLVNQVMKAMGRCVLEQFAKNLEPAERHVAAKLLLARSDQHLDREKFRFLLSKYADAMKAEAEKAKATEKGGDGKGGLSSKTLEKIEEELRLF